MRIRRNRYIFAQIYPEFAPRTKEHPDECRGGVEAVQHSPRARRNTCITPVGAPPKGEFTPRAQEYLLAQKQFLAQKQYATAIGCCATTTALPPHPPITAYMPRIRGVGSLIGLGRGLTSVARFVLRTQGASLDMDIDGCLSMCLLKIGC